MIRIVGNLFQKQVWIVENYKGVGRNDDSQPRFLKKSPRLCKENDLLKNIGKWRVPKRGTQEFMAVLLCQ